MRRHAPVLAILAASAAAAALLLLLPPFGDEPVPGPDPDPLEAPGPKDAGDGPPAPREPPPSVPPALPGIPAPAPPAGEPWARVTGNVRDEAGAPLPGVLVALAAPWGSTDRLLGPAQAFDRLRTGVPSSWASAETAADGSFALAASKPGPHLLLAGPPAFLEAWAEVGLRPGAPPAPVALVLRKGLSVEGRVADLVTGEGVEGVSILAEQPGEAFGGTRRRKAVSAAFGRFAVEGLDAGPVLLKTVVPESLEVVAPEETIEAVGGGRDLRIDVAPVGRVEFRALWTDTGEPVDGLAHVRAADGEPGDRRWRHFYARVVREGPGVFVLVALAGSCDYLLAVPSLGDVRARFEVLPRRRTVRAEPVLFGRGPWLEGDLGWWADPNLPEGEALARGAQVFAERLDAPGEPVRSARIPPEKSRTVHYRVPLPGPGRWLFTALSPGCAPAQAEFAVGKGGATWNVAF
ncbi:MAG: carboxypeptidase-like regulatory domain-containing protein, partial [Planctomycetes bacterium]|nr:carboxypeptidase-like regulatory domain-containing protein [Planctomycetota bacterium]